MVNEERIKIMTRIAMLEERKGKESLAIGTYYKGDYISFQMVRTFLATTLAFILMLSLFVIYRLDYFVSSLLETELGLWSKEILVFFSCYSMIFQAIAYGVYAMRYRLAKKHLKDLKENIHRLSDLYKTEATESRE